MRVRYLYSACVVIEADDASICCDPWFTPGAYDGSWFAYPPLEADPVELVGAVDAIYVSHIHPDHYDAAFLRRYQQAHPDVRLLIGATTPPHLANKMRVDGFAPEVVERLELGSATVTILPNSAYEEVDAVDTALVVVADGQSVVNLNDNPIDLDQVDAVLAACGGRPTVALLPYAGAGPYPQTYEFASDEERDAAAARKQEQFLAVFDRYVELLDPQWAIPFAGQYVLGGPLMELNEHRGVPDAVVAAQRHPDRALVLGDGGREWLDLATGTATAIRTEPYDPAAVAAHLRALPFEGYDYERELRPAADRVLPLVPLLASAHARARARASTTDPFWFCLTTTPGRFLCFDTSQDAGVSIRSDVDDLEPRCEIEVDERYLFGLLTRLYHWNNAEIGSHYRARRVPDVYRRDAYAFLHYLQV